MLRHMVLLPLAFMALSVDGAQGAGGRFAAAHESTVSYTQTPHSPATPCAQLAALATDGITVRTTLVPAADGVPEHCEIIANVPAETGVYIGLPTRWNGRIWMMGNGGFAGGGVERQGQNASDPTAPRRIGAMNAGLNHGFVTVYTNGGHYSGNPLDGSFALDRPDLMADLAHSAVHKGITLAKRAVALYFGRAPLYSYFEGCSTGGRQGLMAATKYPDDFDGIASCAPTLRWGDIMIKARWNQTALDSTPTLTQARLSTVFEAVLKKCDALDGVQDGLINDPRRCDFDPSHDLPRCETKDAEGCFTETEIAALQKLRAGPPIEGSHPLPQYWDTLAPSTAFGWLANADGSPLALSLMAQSFFQYAAFPEQNPDYDWAAFDFGRDPQRMAHFNALMNPTPNLEAFQARGGKIVGFWGWSDSALNPAMGIAYYNEVMARFGASDTQGFYRLFFIPGVAHCAGGYGPDEIDIMTPLIEWVEADRAPDRLAARKTVDGQTKYNRTYCPYPQRTVFQGGNPEMPENWACVPPERQDR